MTLLIGPSAESSALLDKEKISFVFKWWRVSALLFGSFSDFFP